MIKLDGRRSSSTMKPEEFAQGERVPERATKPLNHRADSQTSPVEKHIVCAIPAKPRTPFSSSFLQPEQFIAELKVATAADVRPELAFLASRRRIEPPEGTHVVAKCESGGELVEPDLESFYEPANSVPTLELCYEGKPAPAPAHLRTKTLKPIVSEKLAAVTETVDKNSEAGDSHGKSSPVLQKAGSFKGASPGVHKMRVRSLRENSGTHEVEGKQSGRLRRMLDWGASMEFLKSSERKLGKKKRANGKPDEECLERIEAASHGEVASHPDVVDDEEGFSPKSSASSVSTTYSEVSSKSQSYKHAGHKKNLKSEAVKSKLWLLRVHQKRGSKESEDDGIFEALRQGAMFDDGTNVDTTGEEADDSLGTLESKNSISKLVAKHKRNSTWDAGKQLNPDHIFSPKQPRLPTRDAHVLLAPPKRLTGDTSRGESEFRSGKPSRLIEQSVPLPLPVEKTMPLRMTVPMPPENMVQLPIRVGSQSSSRGPQLRATSPRASKSPTLHSLARNDATAGAGSLKGLNSVEQLSLEDSSPTSSSLQAQARSLVQHDTRVAQHELPRPRSRSDSTIARNGVNGSKAPGGGGMQSTPISPYGATATGPGGAGIQSSLMDATAGTGSLKGPNSVEQFSLEDSSPSSSLQAQVPSSVAQQELPRFQSRSEFPSGANAGRPLPREPRQGGFSFEQIVAGRGRSPPTDNTLMKFFFKCREIEGLNKFLALQKRRFLDSSFADCEKCFHMIMSDAGAGLSSMISTICTAWLLENTMASVTSRVWHPIPVMNMWQKDMWNHRDAAWLFHVCGIDSNAVLFRDEITSTNEAVISGRVKRAVIGQDILVTKADEVASSCTIVSEKFRQEAPKLLQARYMMTLLLAGILVDTNNLSSGSSRDKQQATILLVGAGSLGRNVFYNHLMNIRGEGYVTTFIKEIYGESNALTAVSGEKPAQLAAGIEQLGTEGATLPKDEKSERPEPLAASKIASEVTAPILSSQKPAIKLSSKSETESKSPPNSKISLALRRLRSRSSAP